MFEDIFELILESEDGDYAFQAQILAEAQPTGW
jgi:hypothetical protein